MQINRLDIDGEVVKKDERYTVKDNKFLKNLVVSSTRLKAGCKTNGHSHDGQEEVYFFMSGSGQILVGDRTYDVGPDSVILIPDGAFHQVTNTEKIQDLYFVCVFDGKRYDG
jgi:mannose-6-phosphate isomerase-like protein (cupin superfamily)|tara:strand:- start:151 stop:486 length:336 start_codon:yes stop_codon:yes gene_type:complete